MTAAHQGNTVRFTTPSGWMMATDLELVEIKQG